MQNVLVAGQDRQTNPSAPVATMTTAVKIVADVVELGQSGCERTGTLFALGDGLEVAHVIVDNGLESREFGVNLRKW